VSHGHFGTGTELSRPPANIFLLLYAMQKKGIKLLIVIIKKDHCFYTQEKPLRSSHYTLVLSSIRTFDVEIEIRSKIEIEIAILVTRTFDFY